MTKIHAVDQSAPEATLKTPDARSTREAASARLAGLLKIVIVGHVDHGKSTLVGRLFHDTGSLPEGKFEAIKAMCERRGMPFEWAFLMDALQAERDQGITIDTSQIWFKTRKRDYVIIDAPGHREFLKNMVSGAAASDAALLVIDAKEGVREQSRRHGYLLHLLGVRQVAVVVNKMDLVNYAEDRFKEVSREIREYLGGLGVEPSFVIPVSAREGDGVARVTDNMAWYDGPTTLEALDRFPASVPTVDQALRFPVQDVYKFDDRRIIAGRIESGRLHVGDEILFSPSNKTARIKSIEGWNNSAPIMAASAGQSIGITLEEQLFIERGEIISHLEEPPMETNVFKAHLFWLGDKPVTVGKRYLMKLATARYTVEVQSIERVIDTADLSGAPAEQVERNAVAEVILRSRAQIALDDFPVNARTGRFVIIEDYDAVGGGIISMEDFPDQRPAAGIKSANIVSVEHRVSQSARDARNGHKPGILWFTGLSGAGKTTLALELENELFRKGYQVFVLDGDNLRYGLNGDLGFDPKDRAENIRRAGEVAGLFADAGTIVITSFISPYRADRRKARAVRPERFHEVYVKADLATCEGRDPKGLYKKARRGEIPKFTGIDAPYEAPEKAELVLDTTKFDIGECVGQLMDYVEVHFGSPAKVATGASAKYGASFSI